MTPYSTFSFLNSSSPVLNGDDQDSAIYPTIEESSFCSNFQCCGRSLKDFHALLQHYEESHVKIEEADDDAPVSGSSLFDVDALIAADSLLNVGTVESKSSRIQTSAPLHVPTPVSAAASRFTTPTNKRPESTNPIQTPAPKRKARIMTLGIEPCDFVGEDLSAFDNTVIRPMDGNRLDYSLLAYNGNQGYSRIAPKRSHSVPALQSFPLIRGEHNFRLIHSILSSTVDPPSNEKNSSSSATSLSRPSGLQNNYSSSGSNSSGPSYYSSSRGSSDRPFICPVNGCGKTYKNANGLKYHAIHGHDGVLVEKPHKCPFAGCGKRYKNSNGLKYHFQHSHPNALPPSGPTTSVQGHVTPRSNSIPPNRPANEFKLPNGALLSSNPVTIANLIKSNPMVKQHLPAILRNLQQMALQRANSDSSTRKPPSNN